MYYCKQLCTLLSKYRRIRELSISTLTTLRCTYYKNGNEPLFISTQGPIKETVADFWSMVLNEGVKLIIMLTKTNENGVEKCTQYWPLEGAFTDSNGVQIECKSATQLKEETLILTELTITDTKGNTSNIKHIHCKCFPDHDTISEEDYAIIDKIVEAIDAYRNESKDARVVMHCSAGIGRTGTIISIYNIKSALDLVAKAEGEETRISVFGTVRRIREQRMGSVQTNDQYSLIYSYFAYRIAKKP